MEKVKLSEYFSLEKKQSELDFVDIYIDHDTPLFLDPWAIRQGGDDFSIICHTIIADFFQELLNKIRKNDKSGAIYMLSGLGEPSETHLGLSKKGFSGSGVGKDKAKLLYNALSDSEAVQTGFLEDLEDTALLIEGIKEDNISDIVTNLLRFQFIKYTQNQCKIHGIETRELPTGHYWNNKANEWEASREKMLVVNGKKIILVPKLFVRRVLSIDFKEYYSMDIIEYEQTLHLDQGTSLCRVLKGGILGKPTKKSLKELHPENKKHFVYEFTKKYPEVLEEFKKKKMNSTSTISQELFEDDDKEKNIENLILKLKKISAGKSQAKAYENIISSILEVIFYPFLYNPILQYKQLDGLKIIDIAFENSASSGFFSDITKANISCRKIYFECKNYFSDIKNPEIDQLNGRFSKQNTQIGFMVCRKVENKKDYFTRVKNYAEKQGHFILLLEDSDLIKLLQLKKDGKENEVDIYLNNKLNFLIGE